MYIDPQHQPAYYDYILELNPKRIVFNPGTENPEFETLAQSKGIDVEEACTLVLLSTGQY
jgi:predicted CoA-binding protein